MLIFLLKSLIVILFILLVFGMSATWTLEQSLSQKHFVKGTFPNPLPDGFYQGTVPGHTVSWLGKKFNATAQMGINVFDDGNGIKGERYSFKISKTKGARDKNLDVLAIDYNISANPWWLRPVLDEIVQVEPNHYLGKLEIRIIPGHPFTVAFFELQK